MRLIRAEEVHRLTGLTTSTQRRMERQGDFPRRRKISARSVAWSEIEVHEWVRRHTTLSTDEPGADQASAAQS